MIKSIKTGSIISYNGANNVLVIIGLTEGNIPIGYNTRTKVSETCWNPNLVKVLNNNYVGTYMTPDQIFTDWFNQALVTIGKINELKKVTQDIKPSLRSETFYFGGLYQSSVFVIEVREITNKHNITRPFLFLNDKEQSDIVFGQLCQIVDQQFAEYTVNIDTVKIGSAIGYTQVLRDVLASYKAMQFTK